MGSGEGDAVRIERDGPVRGGCDCEVCYGICDCPPEDDPETAPVDPQ